MLVVIAPTNTKGSLSQVWQQATRELEDADEFIVIGYSLPETDFFFGIFLLLEL